VAQSAEYRASVLPKGVKRVAIEAGRGESFGTLLGEEGLFIGWEKFGASAPAEILAEQFGLTPAKVADTIAAFVKG
jgi:transketolase